MIAWRSILTMTVLTCMLASAGDALGWGASGHRMVSQVGMENLPPELPEGSRFEVSLVYEKTGLLQVIARHPETGRVASTSVERRVTTPFGGIKYRCGDGFLPRIIWSNNIAAS